MLKEFRTFIMRGNVLDLAVAVIIGGAFGKIITSFVNDIIMPPIGMMLGNVNFSDLFVDLSGKGYPNLTAAQDAGAPTINYGLFINNVIDFVIIAFVIFSSDQSGQIHSRNQLLKRCLLPKNVPDAFQQYRSRLPAVRIALQK